MTSTVSNVSVAAPVDAVWDLLAAYADISRWAGSVSQSNLLTEGPPGVGSVRRVQVGRSALRETVTVWEPGRSLAYDIGGLPAVVTTATNAWTLVATAAGTDVTLTSDVETRGGPLVARLVARRLGRVGAELTQSLAADLRRQLP